MLEDMPRNLHEPRLQFVTLDQGDSVSSTPEATRFQRGIQQRRRQNLMAYLMAGLSFATVAILLTFVIEDVEFLPRLTLVMILIYIFPIIPTMGMIWGSRAYQIG